MQATNEEDPSGPPPTNEDGTPVLVRWAPPENFSQKLVQRACDQPELAQKRIEVEWKALVSSDAYATLVASLLPQNRFCVDGSQTPDALLETVLKALPFREFAT